MEKIELPVRVVFDCMVFVQAAARTASPANACLEIVRKGEAKLYLSPAIVAEVENVLTRPKIRKRFSTLTDEGVHTFLTDVLSISLLVRNVPSIFEYPRDPKDEKYIDLAAEAEADFIVTRDSDLLDLMTGTDIESKQFRQRFRELKIVRPDKFLRIVSKVDA